ncbi:MAG: type II secretion system F family protein [Chloroflexota bacterium]
MALLVAPLATFITVTLLVTSLLTPRRNEAAEKLRPYTYRSSRERDALSRPFSERVIVPLLEWLGRLAGSSTPSQVQERLEALLRRAGEPISIHAFLALRAICALGLPLGYLGILLGLHSSPGFGQLVVAAVLLFAGALLPKYWISQRVRDRQKEIERSLPDALDLIVVSMEAGLAFDAAMAKVVDKSRGPLAQEFRKALHEVQLGKPRREALKRLGTRTGVNDLIALVNSIAQADQMGVSMAQVMRTQADEARLKRRQRAEERAHQAAVKMLFPLVLFILPSVMIVTVGPAALSIYHQFHAGLLGG